MIKSLFYSIIIEYDPIDFKKNEIVKKESFLPFLIVPNLNQTLNLKEASRLYIDLFLELYDEVFECKSLINRYLFLTHTNPNLLGL